MGDGMKISVIIPTLNAAGEIEKLIDILERQTVKADEIVIVDSQSDDGTVAICRERNARVIEILRSEFDHGKTRDLALRSCESEFVLFLTQDALPKDEHYIENLLKPFDDESVAVCSGRQLPKEDARAAERLIREFNYPEVSNVRSKEDLERLGIKTFFFSDACSAYRKDVYLELGGFDYPILTDEDLFFAAKAINAGYKVAYAADAAVFHSHNLSLREQYERNRIQGIEFKRHAELLQGVSLESEGMKMVKYVTKGLLKEGRIPAVIGFFFDCAARYLGSRAGRA